MAEEHDLTTVLGLEGYDEEYSLSEFTEYFNTDLSSQKFNWGWVFWRPEACYQESSTYELGDGFSFTVPNSSSVYGRAIQEKIKRVLQGRTFKWIRGWEGSLAQFWAAKMAGQWCYLTTADQPFAVGRLHKGFCWYRKHSVGHHYIVDEGAKEDELGAVGRVFRSGHPESSPDLRLYSDKEFPLRDHAVRCGARKYIALPVFDLLKKECYGVLEVLYSDEADMGHALYGLSEQLQAAELRSTHMDFCRISRKRNGMPPKYKQHERGEIAKMLELAVEVVPQIHIAQAWLPCKQCAKTTSNLSCMERVALITGIDKMVNLCKYINYDYEYLQACEFHNLQIGNGITKTVIESNYKSCFCRNICDFSISEYPLAHYARKARLSFCFAICLESVHNSNEIYVVEFFLQSNSREEAYVGSFMHLISRIMKMKLKSFKVASGRQFREELAVEVSKNMLASFENMFAPRYEIVEYTQERNHQRSKEFNMLMMMKGCRKKCSVADFTKYLQKDDLLSCSKPPGKRRNGWLFWCPEREDLAADEVTSNSFVPNWEFRKQIRFLLSKMISKWAWRAYCLVQFWALKMDEDRCYLSTSGQPFALGCLCKGLRKFRKQCMEHKYFVDEGAKEEELGPPGRVFRGGHPEMTDDLRLYSVREFPLRNHAERCRLRRYIALPILDLQHKCVGILELLEFGEIERIPKALEEANLSLTYLNLKPTFRIIDDSLNEIKEALQLVTTIPQLYMAEVWVSNNHCATINNNLTCITQALSTKKISRKVDEGLRQFQHIQTGKGIAGMVLASENKSCFCQNSCDFSIIEQPQAHYAQRERLDVCFAICLQSSLTGNILYILNFFLNQCPGDDEYLWSFCYLLMPMLKQKLKSFKVASGQQLGDELVVEVIKSSHEVEQLSFSNEFRRTNIFPLKFKIVQYDQNKHHHLHSKDQQENFVASATEPKRCHTPAVNSNKRKKIDEGQKMKSTGGLRIKREDLIPHFGKRLKDVSKELRVSRSTIKRACRYYGITRWPSNETYKQNPSLFENETQNANKDAPDSQQNIWPTGGSNLPPSDLPSNDNVPQANPTSTQQLTLLPADAEMVIIKAKYEEDTIKFQLPLPSEFNDLVKQVASRLTLNIGCFKLKYLDEDNDEILLTCDVDLQLCLKNLIGAGKTFIQLFVQLIRE